MGSSEKWTRENLAWCAGIIEGEGSIALQRGYMPHIAVEMSDRDIIERLADILGAGVISSRTRVVAAGPRKPLYRLMICPREEVQAILAALYEWLGERRRERVIEVLTARNTHIDGRRRLVAA